MRLDNAVSVFLSEWPAEGVAAGTLRSYSQALAWFVGFATERGKIALADALTPSIVRAAIRSKMASTSTVDRASNYKGGEAAGAQLAYATRKLARWLLDQGVPVENLESVKAPKVPERIQPRLRPDEFHAMESAVLHRLLSNGKRVPHLAVSRDLALLNLLGETGLRAEEVCRMEVGHIDLEHGWVAIRRGKGGKERILSIVGTDDDTDPDRVARLLEDWLSARSAISAAKTHQRVWTSTRGTPLTPDELRKVLARICIEAGMASNRPPHTFRRYVFTEHYRERPGSLRRLAARMGWSERSHKMISTYTRGVELELAREPLPLLSLRRQTDGPKVRPHALAFPAVTSRGVGPPSGAKVSGPALPNLGGRDRTRAASQAPQRRPAP